MEADRAVRVRQVAPEEARRTGCLPCATAVARKFQSTLRVFPGGSRNGAGGADLTPAPGDVFGANLCSALSAEPRFAPKTSPGANLCSALSAEPGKCQ